MPLGRRRIGRPGLLGTVARTTVIAGTATAVSNKVNQRASARSVQAQEAAAWEQQQQWAAQQAAAAPPPTAPAPAPAASGDTITQLKELAALKEQGVLTDDEFAAQKAKILGS